MTYADEQLHTAQVLASLATTGLDIGDGVAPSPAVFPYIVLYDLGAADRDGPMNDQNADTELAYQITAVGVTREQAAWAREQARTAILVTGVTPPAGRAWMGDFVLELGRPVERDDGDGEQDPLYYAIDEYRLMSTPA